MAYTKLGWVNDRAPALNQTNLNHMDQGIYDAHQKLSEYEDIFIGDVDESVQNWLDEHPEATTTVEDGSITEAKLADSLRTRKISSYNTVASMASDSTLIAGMTVSVNGYNAINDGNGAVYYIREKTSDDVINAQSIIQMSDNSLVAERIYSGEFSLNGGIALSAGTDLNEVIIGNYRCASTETAKSIINAPTSVAFAIKAFYINNFQNIGQLIEDIEGAIFFRRGYYNEQNSYTWLEWKTLRGYLGEKAEIADELLNCALTYYDNADSLYYGNNSTAVNARINNPLGYWDGATDDLWRWTALEKRTDNNLYYVFTDNTYSQTFDASKCATDTDVDVIAERVEALKNNHSNIVCQIDCNTFVFLVESGVSYQNSRYAKWWQDIEHPEINTKGYDWGFEWGDLTGYWEQVSGNRLLANTMCHYCIDKGYAFDVLSNWNNLEVGDIIFEVPPNSADGWSPVSHVLIYLGRVKNGQHKIIEVRGRDETIAKAPVRYITIDRADYEAVFRYGARIIEPMAEKSTLSVLPVAFTPVAGQSYSSFDGCYYYKRGSRVHVHIGISDITANTRTTVFTLPQGFRPYRAITQYGTASSIANIAKATISKLGVIDVYSSGTYANIDLEYDAFS